MEFLGSTKGAAMAVATKRSIGVFDTTGIVPLAKRPRVEASLALQELQRVLGVAIDGDFGSATLKALQAKKGVSSISLNAYLKNSVQTKVTIKANPTALVTPKKGQKLMANINSLLRNR